MLGGQKCIDIEVLVEEKYLKKIVTTFYLCKLFDSVTKGEKKSYFSSDKITMIVTLDNRPATRQI